MKISMKKLSIVTDVILLALSCAYFALSFQIKDSASLNLSPAFYPRLLAAGLFLMVLAALYIDIFGAGRSEKRSVEIGSVRKQLSILIATVLFVIVWQELKVFYPAVFVLVLCLVWVYNQESASLRKLGKVALIAAVFTLLIYLIFGVAIATEFV